MRSLVVMFIAVVLACAPAPATAVRGAPAPDALESIDDLREQRRWAEAESLAAVALERAQRSHPPDSTLLARALYYQSRLNWDRQQYTDTLMTARLDRVERIFRAMARPDTNLLVLALTFHGTILSELQQGDHGLRQFERARDLCSPTLVGGDTLRAALWFNIGRAQRRLRLADDALRSLERARESFERRLGPDDPRVATIVGEIAYAYLDQTRFDEALAAANRALAVFERASGPQHETVLRPLAIIAEVQYRTGDVAGSIETLQREVDIALRRGGPSDPRVIPYQFNLALRYFDFGDYVGARARLEPMIGTAEAAFGVGSARTERLRAMTGAAALLAGDTASAARHLERAWAELAKKPLDPYRFMAFADRWLGRLYLMRGDLPSARKAILRGLATERGNARPQLEMVMSLLEAQLDVAIAMRDTAAVDSAVAGMAAPFPTPQTRLAGAYATALRLQARAAAWEGHGDEAWAKGLEAERLERARLMLNLRSLPDRRGLELAGGLAEPLDLLVSLARGRGDDAVVTAWDRLVRWRGLVAAEMLGRRAPAGASADTAMLAAHARWIAARRANARLEVAGAEGGDEAAGPLAASRAAAEEAERHYAALAAVRGIRGDTATVDLARVRARLAPSEALVSLVELHSQTDSARCVAFVARGPAGAPRLLDLGPASELKASIAAWRVSLATPPGRRDGADERACRALGRDVRARTWGRLAASIGDAADVVLVADGALADLPWQALPDGSSRYFAEAGPTLHTLSAERELLATDEPSGRGMLALGGPDFQHTEPAAAAPPSQLVATSLRGPLANCATASRLAFASLPGAAGEVSEVADLWDLSHPGARALRRLGPEANEAAFKRDAPGRAIVHLATHGIVWGDSCAPVPANTRGVGGVGPVASPAKKRTRPANVAAAAAPPAAVPSPWLGRQVWLALAGANAARAGGPDENEGLLTADEVSVMDLRGVDWIVLSACHSGFGEEWPREGSVGMSRAFRLAGARTVLASQWAIGDESTREWMAALYRARGTTRSAGACLQQASRGVLAARRRAHESTHPFYWASFTATGE